MILFKALKKWLLYAYIFYVIYTPVFSPSIIFDKYIVLYGLLFVVLFPYILRRDKSLWKILGHKNVLYLMAFIFLSSLYFTVVQLMNNVEIQSFMDLRLVQNNIINVLIVHAAVIIDKLNRQGFSRRKSFELLLKFGALQGIICLLSLVLPFFKDIAIHLYQATGGFNTFVMDARIYGISSDYTFGTPIYHGLLAGIAVYDIIKNGRRKNYYLYILLILAAVFLNGRTGLVVFLLVSVVSMFYWYIKRHQKMRILGATAALVFVVIGSLGVLQYASPSTYSFVNSFIDDTKNLVVDGKLTGNYQVLLGESLHLPQNEQLVFGEGYRVYDSDAVDRFGFRSDIGYVNDIYMGGLVFALMSYLSLFYFLVYRSQENMVLFLTIALIGMIVNFKGEILRSAIFMFLIIYMKMLMQTRLDGKNERKTA